LFPKGATLKALAQCRAGDGHRGLGDWTERMLASIGITKERYVAAKQLFGLAPTCNCAKRKAWLNRVSDWWRGESSSGRRA
jgi:hypothetical protein